MMHLLILISVLLNRIDFHCRLLQVPKGFPEFLLLISKIELLIKIITKIIENNIIIQILIRILVKLRLIE